MVKSFLGAFVGPSDLTMRHLARVKCGFEVVYASF